MYKTILLLLILALLSSCKPAGNPADPAAIHLTPGSGGLTGQVSSAPERWSGAELTIYAAPFTRTQGNDEGFYVLEPNIHPHAQLDASGSFNMVNIPPGEYVLIVGPNPREGKAVLNGTNHPQVFTIQADQIFQAGALAIAP